MQWPDAKHSIIAHSHGGNVALGSLAAQGLKSDIAAFVCLSTPFLLVSARNLGASRLTSLVFAAFYLFLIIPLLAVSLVDSYLLIDDYLLATFFSMPAWAVYVAITAYLTVCLILAKVYYNWGFQFEAKYSLPRGDFPATLIVLTSGDEASGLLISPQFLSWLINRPWLLADAIVTRLESAAERWNIFNRWENPFFGAVFVLGGIWAAIMAGVFLGSRETYYWLGYLFMAAAVPAALVLVLRYLASFTRFSVTLLLIPFVIVASVLLLPFGPGMVLSTPFVEVTVESTPPGEWVVYRARTTLDGGSSFLGLAHSRGYDDPDCIGRIVEWIAIQGAVRKADAM